METENVVMVSPGLVEHCHDYQARAGLGTQGFTVRRDTQGSIYVVMTCEDEAGNVFLSRAPIEVATDESIYCAVMVCTEALLAKQSTIH
jgi:hypothetical protein